MTLTMQNKYIWRGQKTEKKYAQMFNVVIAGQQNYDLFLIFLFSPQFFYIP